MINTPFCFTRIYVKCIKVNCKKKSNINSRKNDKDAKDIPVKVGIPYSKGRFKIFLFFCSFMKKKKHKNKIAAKLYHKLL